MPNTPPHIILIFGSFSAALVYRCSVQSSELRRKIDQKKSCAYLEPQIIISNPFSAPEGSIKHPRNSFPVSELPQESRSSFLPGQRISFFNTARACANSAHKYIPICNTAATLAVHKMARLLIAASIWIMAMMKPVFGNTALHHVR